MAKYQQYAAYKDSGVEWLGEIPTKWKITALKRYCNVKGGHAFSSDIFSIEGEPIIRIGDIKADGSISLENCKFIPTKLAKSSHAYLVEKGQLLMAMTGATIGKAGVYTNDSPAYLNQRVGKFEIDNDELDYSFLWYTLKTNGYQEYIKLTAFGGAQPNISDTGMVDYISCFPSLSEQTQIANFLDHETAQIDTLIEKQQTLIQLLKEKRQAVISHAVTKGVNPDAPMKDSGVEWLGDVPEHWDIVKLSYKMKLLSGDGITSQDIEPVGQYSVYGGNGLRGYTARYNCDGHYVLIGRQGALCGNINLAQGKFFATEHAVVVYPHQNFDISFLSEFLRFMDLGQYSVSAAQPGISVERINGLKILIPPYDEQVEIGEHIKKIVIRFKDLSTKAYQQIELLQERRTALISAAVTGKIDVRGWRVSDSK